MITPAFQPTPAAHLKASESTRAERRLWVDATRGFGILLVVIGHTLRGLTASGILSDKGMWGFVDRFIYAFHMPLFFFISGLFVIPSRNESFWRFSQRRLVRLGYPYLLWATLQTFMQILLSRYTNHRVGVEELWSIGYAPPMQFWFLYALLLQVLLIGLLSKLGLSRGAILAIAFVAYITAPYVSLGAWGTLYQARDSLVYTALGAFVGAPTRIGFIDRQRTGLYPAVALGGFLLTAFVVVDQRSDHHLLAGLISLLGTAASVSTCVLLARASALRPVSAPELCSHADPRASTPGMPRERVTRARVTQLLISWGEASLAIYVAHTLISAGVRVVLTKALHTENSTLHLVLGTVAGLCIPWALFLVGKRRRLPYLFEWPTSERTSVPSAP